MGGDLSWFWMGYINSGGWRITMTFDGDVVFEYITDISDHLLDYQVESTDISGYLGGNHEVCLNYERGNCPGDNYFADFLDGSGITPVGVSQTCFSTLKSSYR